MTAAFLLVMFLMMRTSSGILTCVLMLTEPDNRGAIRKIDKEIRRLERMAWKPTVHPHPSTPEQWAAYHAALREVIARKEAAKAALLRAR